MWKPTSSLGIKYPTLRDHPLKTGHNWLEGKRADDGAEGLWRIHDNLYDLEKFVQNHPGGASWLQITKGTDITEAFETHHLSDEPENILKKYLVRKAEQGRNYPFTFRDGEFYRILKQNVREELKKIPAGKSKRSKYISDLLMLSYLFSAVFAIYSGSFSVGILAGVLLSVTAITAHNFFHQKDNFRMYYFDLTLMRSSEWRISHALSHHLYTNTVKDLEISLFEPFFQWLPRQKSVFVKYFQLIATPFVYCLGFFVSFITDLIELAILRNPSPVFFLRFVVLVIPLLMLGEVLSPLLMFLWIQLVGSFYLLAVGLNAAHHHPDIFHDGDTPRPKEEMDWGVYQLDAVMDRKDITGSHFLVLTNFGDHALHHLFPTLDHAVLEYLYPVFRKTCADFGIEWRMVSQIELIKGQFRQLLKIEGRKEPPKRLKKKIL